MRDASFSFSFGTKIYSNPAWLAKITEGKIELTPLSLPSKASSQINTDLSRISLSRLKLFPKIPIAMGKSKNHHFFFIVAGARFTVILVHGNLYQLFFIAALTLSLLS